MEIIVLWLFFALLVGFYAESKGHSGMGMFFLSALLSPLIGLLIELVRSPNQKRLGKQAVRRGEMKKCPACAELVLAEATKCRYCSENFAAPGQPAG